MKPNNYATWGATPGKEDIKVVRSFKVFNITNPDEIMNGAKPIVVEAPEITHQEYSLLKNWEYLDKDEQSLGQDKSGEFIEYNYQLEVKPIPSNGTTIPLTTKLTGFNLPQFLSVYSLTHQQFPFYSLSVIYDIAIAFQDDLYDMIIAYSMYQTYFNDTILVNADLTAANFSSSDCDLLISDAKYGFADWQPLKTWVKAYFDYQNTLKFTDNAFEILENYFQIPNLSSLLTKDGLVAIKINEVLESMNVTYKTIDRVELRNLQWNSALMTKELPMGIGSVPLTKEIPYPSFLSLNQTFSYPPEINIFLAAVNISADYSTVADRLLNISYGYPKSNYGSILNLVNMAEFLTDASTFNLPAISKNFLLTNPNQVAGLATYLYGMPVLPITYDNIKTEHDGYSHSLSRWTHKALIKGIINLKNDVFWAIPAKLIFCDYQANLTTCETTIGAQNNAAAICKNKTIGWNIDDASTWNNLQTWIKAAVKPKGSNDYKLILDSNLVTDAQLESILENSFMSQAQDALAAISKHYGCPKPICTYDELLDRQWGTSEISFNLLPELLNCGVTKSRTFQS